MIIYTREPPAYGGAHIEGSYSIWLLVLPNFAGWRLPYNRPILLILEDSFYLEKAIRYLTRLGYDKIAGYLRGGIEHKGTGLEDGYNAGFPIHHLGLLSVQELKQKMGNNEDISILDVRSEDE